MEEKAPSAPSVEPLPTSKVQVLEQELQKERILRQKLQNRVQDQQQQIYKQAHPNPILKESHDPLHTKKANKFTFTCVVSQVSPQSDGKIHVTGGYKLLGYIVLKVKTGEPFYLSALSLSLRRIEEVMVADAEAATKKKILVSLMFPVSQYFANCSNQPSEKGFYSWKKGTYQFPFQVETSTSYLPSFEYKQTEPFFQIANRSYSLDIHYRKSVSTNEPWVICHRTPIIIHMFRKQPEIISFSQSQTFVEKKLSKFVFKKGSIQSCISLLEQKTVYFMCYHSIPLRFEIDNQSNFRIKKVSLRLCQELYYRTSSKGSAFLMKHYTLWQREMDTLLDLPLPKETLKTVEKLVIPLDSPYITPTLVKQQKTLFFVNHFIELLIKTPKQVSDISLKIPLTICEPPIEHLAQAIYNRAYGDKNTSSPIMNSNSASSSKDPSVKLGTSR